MSEVRRVLLKVLEPDPLAPPITEGGFGGFFTAEMIQQRWEYRDFPRMDEITWAVIREMIIGHYKPLTWARYPNGQCRGQVVVSPEGIRIMRERCETAVN